MSHQEAEARQAAVLTGRLRETSGLMNKQQAKLRAQEVKLHELEAHLATEAAAREAQSAELGSMLDRLETLKTQVLSALLFLFRSVN